MRHVLSLYKSSNGFAQQGEMTSVSGLLPEYDGSSAATDPSVNPCYLRLQTSLRLHFARLRPLPHEDMPHRDARFLALEPRPARVGLSGGIGREGGAAGVRRRLG